MNKTRITFLILFAACGNPEDPVSRLQDLKQEEARIRQEIGKLEAEIAASDTAAKRSRNVVVTDIRPTTFSHYIEVQAKVEGDEDVTLSAQTMGTIISLPAEAGKRVSKGLALAIVDDRAIRQNLESVRAQYELAQTVYYKQKNLWDQEIGSEIQFLDAKARKESLERQVAGLEEQLQLTRIKSPINGTVDRVFVKKGQTVAPGVPVARVVNLRDLKVTGEIAEAFISKVNKGNPVRLYFPDSGDELDARVHYSGKAINPLNRTFNVEVRLSTDQGTYYPNQVVVLKIADYVSDSAYVVPVGAVLKGSDGEYVYVATRNGSHYIAARRPVRSGMVYNGKVEVRDGLAGGDRVVTLGYQSLVEGDVIAF